MSIEYVSQGEMPPCPHCGDYLDVIAVVCSIDGYGLTGLPLDQDGYVREWKELNLPVFKCDVCCGLTAVGREEGTLPYIAPCRSETDLRYLALVESGQL